MLHGERKVRKCSKNGARFARIPTAIVSWLLATWWAKPPSIPDLACVAAHTGSLV